jgi:membrane-associated phospholipid phosphatase
MPVRSIIFALLLASATAGCASAQGASSTIPDAPQPQNHSSDQVTIASTPRHILSDQLAIWSSPAHLNESNAAGPVLLVLATAVVITTDHQMMSEEVPIDTSLNNHAVTASNGLTGGFIAAPAIIYGLGHIHHDDHATETGILGGEAMADSLAVDEVLKLVSLRERPAVDGARGKFFQTSVGLDSSFPSTHSFIAWSSAAVIASEYDGLLTQITAYGLATVVSATRVLGRQHFPSDVLVGSAVGWMIGRYVVHHRRRLD